jgi:hypothetical protein
MSTCPSAIRRRERCQSLYKEVVDSVEALRNLAQQRNSNLKKQAADRLREAAERAARYAEQGG